MADELDSDFRGIPKRQTFRLGDTVRIRTGAFTAFTGKIEGINQGRRLLKVEVEIFGRKAPIKLGFDEVEKLSFS
jgi:transcriptional antiterminator NusG